MTTQQIKDLREETGAGVMDCRDALQQANGDYDEALDFLRQKGIATAAKRADREATDGVVELYSHGDGRVGVILEVNCETDFVARSKTFRKFAHEMALQIAAGAPRYVSPEDIPQEVIEGKRKDARERAIEDGKPEKVIDRIVEGRLKKFLDEVCLMRQPYVRDDDITVEELLMQNIGSIGENIIVRRFERWELGEDTME
ncbi:translation elongation factor Ts [Chloroflexota bacterium]